MVTMNVVVGLGAAVLVGIAVTYYFTVRRNRAVRGGSSSAASAARRASPPRPSQAPGAPRAVTRRPGPRDSRNVRDVRDVRDDAGAGSSETAKARKRVGWRKGADVDEELWPAEAFGGVTDE